VLCRRHPTLPPLLLVVLFTLAAIFAHRPAAAAVYNLKFGAGYAAASNTASSGAFAYTGAGSWHEVYPSAKEEVYIDAVSQLGGPFNVSDIASISYHTLNNGTNPSGVDFYVIVYTDPTGPCPVGPSGSFYCKRLIAEPYLADSYTPQVAPVWSTWGTGAGTNQLRWCDPNMSGNFGFYGQPTLADLQGGPINWSTWPGNPTSGSANATPINYATQKVKYISFQTGSGWASFDGYLDGITITKTNGDVYNIDLETTTDPVYADDNWVGAAPGVEASPGRFIGFNAFPTIQGAVDAAIPSGTVNVLAGTYTEQVTVNGKSLSVSGAGAGVTVVQSPLTLATIFTSGGNPNKPVLSAVGAANVVFEDMTLNGLGRGAGNYRMEGVGYWNAGGKVEDMTITGIRENPLNGTQHGVGVYSNNNTGGPYSLECSRLDVNDYQKNAFALSGSGMSVNVHDCTCTGAGSLSNQAQNGVQVGFGAGGSVTNCAISNMSYSPQTDVASGLLVYQPGSTVTVSGLTGANAITSVQAPVSWYDGNGSINGIETSGGADFGPIFVGNFSTLLAKAARPAKAAGAGAGGRIPPAPFDEGLSVPGGGTNAFVSYSVTISNGCLTGSDAPGTAGVYAYSGGGPLAVSVLNTNLHDWDYGLVADGGAVALTATDNSIASNVTAGYDNTMSGSAQNAESNWWGDAGGPAGAGDDVLGANVDYTPWLISGTDTDAACGFTPIADNQVTVGPAPGCVSIGNPCITIPVNITRSTSDNVRGFSINVQLSANLLLCAGTGSITEGTYLNAVGGTTFQVISNGGGSYTVDCAILGLPCGATAPTGNLFNIAVKKAPGPDGTGTITLSSPLLRDCLNAPVTTSVGAPLSITIDATAPSAIAALAAAQQTSGNDADGTTKINLSWPAVEAGATVKIYRAGFGNYPEYDDPPGAGSVPATPGYPPGAPWALAASVSGPTSYADEVTNRDFWYFVAFVVDGCGNVSTVSNKTGGTLNYHLGDTHNGITNCAGNNLVNTSDISHLGANYGVTLVASDPRACMDVGPTTNAYVTGRPLTDNLLNFEDLILYAINYGTVSAPQDGPQIAASDVNEVKLNVPETRAVGEMFTVGLWMKAAGNIQGMSVDLSYNAAVVEPVGVEPGELLSRQPQGSTVLSARPGNLDLVLLGVGRGIAGEGVVAQARFRVKSAGDPGIGLARVDARNAENAAVAMGSRPSGSEAPPSRTGIAAVGPNPFADRTSIQLSLSQDGPVKLSLYDVTGREVRWLVNGTMTAGLRVVEWDGRSSSGARLPVGFYVLRLEAAGVTQSRPIFIVK